MTKKQWLALLALYVTYLFLGASVFFYLEKDQETIQRDNDYKLYEKLVAAVKQSGVNESVVADLENYCGRPLTENADLDDITPRLWDFYNSVFFVITVVSTVGYGNIHPTTPLTRAIMMFYAIIGIPINGILLTSLAQFFSTVFLRAHKKYKRYESRCGLAVDVLKYLVPGILFFIFVPATAFYYFEGWTYDESVYFAFVTLTTIGFGDIVAGQKQFKEFDSDLILLYKSLLLCWIIFGLGYLIMLLGFITRAMRSKRMVQFEHKLVEALTHSKIWHGFSKDIGYLRRVMNELYLDNFKPVYKDERQHQKNIFHRSKSLPNFVFGIDEENFFDPVDLYKRGSSEYAFFKTRFSRAYSESDLTSIDKSATFASVARIQPDELIRHVVGVMGGSRGRQDLSGVTEQRGVDVFSDEEILRSEAWYDKKDSGIASVNFPPTYEEAILSRRKRGRALSECPSLNNVNTVTSGDNFEWTWSGAGSTKIFEMVNERLKKSRNQQSKLKKLPPTMGMKWLNPRRKRVKCYSESISESKKSVCSSGDAAPGTQSYRDEGHYMTYTAASGAKGIGLMHGKGGLSKPERSLVELYMSGDHLFSSGNRDTFHGTSITEFLSALSSIHCRINTGSNGEVRAMLPGSPPPKVESLVNLFSPQEPAHPKARPADKVQEPSNLKRLGRFLLRSYSKTDTDKEYPQASSRKSLPLRTSETYLADNYHTRESGPSVAIEMEEETKATNGNFSNFSVDEGGSQEQGTSKGGGIISNISLLMRRDSSPAVTIGPGRGATERPRIGTLEPSQLVSEATSDLPKMWVTGFAVVAAISAADAVDPSKTDSWIAYAKPHQEHRVEAVAEKIALPVSYSYFSSSDRSSAGFPVPRLGVPTKALRTASGTNRKSSSNPQQVHKQTIQFPLNTVLPGNSINFDNRHHPELLEAVHTFSDLTPERKPQEHFLVTHDTVTLPEGEEGIAAVSSRTRITNGERGTYPYREFTKTTRNAKGQGERVVEREQHLRVHHGFNDDPFFDVGKSEESESKDYED